MARVLMLLLVLLLLLLLVPLPVAAQDLLLNARVRIVAGTRVPVTGVVTVADSEALVVRTGNGTTVQIARSDIRSLQIGRGRRSHALRGLLAGALAWGAIVGAYAAFDTLDESGVGEPLFIGGLVVAGGVVGGLIRTERWEPVPASPVAITASLRHKGVIARVAVRF